MSETQLPKIEKGIPIPTKTGGGKCQSFIQMMRSMEIGDSVVMKNEDMHTLRTLASQNGMKISARAISKAEKRVWRIV